MGGHATDAPPAPERAAGPPAPTEDGGGLPAAHEEASNRALIVVAMMAATVMQALDTTIVNDALPHMAGNLGASMDQIAWVLTSYLIASSVVMAVWVWGFISTTTFIGSLSGFSALTLSTSAAF